MAREASVIIGSGINPLKQEHCVNETTQERHLRGTSVVVLNPEDGSAGGSGLVTAMTINSITVKIPTAPLEYRRAISICNNSTTDILYIGFDPGVTTGTGWPVPAGTAISLDINGAVLLYGVSSNAGGMDIRVLELA